MAARAGQKINRIDSQTGSTRPEGRDRAGPPERPRGRKEDSLVHVAVALRRLAVAVRAAAAAHRARICQTHKKQNTDAS